MLRDQDTFACPTDGVTTSIKVYLKLKCPMVATYEGHDENLRTLGIESKMPGVGFEPAT